MKKSILWILIILLSVSLIGALSNGGCEKNFNKALNIETEEDDKAEENSPPPENNYPTVIVTGCNADYYTSSQCEISVECNDPDGDTLECTLNTDGGNFTDLKFPDPDLPNETIEPTLTYSYAVDMAGSYIVTWMAPDTPGMCNINFEVNDGKGGKASKTLNIQVIDRPYEQISYENLVPPPGCTGNILEEHGARGSLDGIPSTCGEHGDFQMSIFSIYYFPDVLPRGTILEELVLNFNYTIYNEGEDYDNEEVVDDVISSLNIYAWPIYNPNFSLSEGLNAENGYSCSIGDDYSIEEDDEYWQWDVNGSCSITESFTLDRNCYGLVFNIGNSYGNEWVCSFDEDAILAEVEASCPSTDGLPPIEENTTDVFGVSVDENRAVSEIDPGSPLYSIIGIGDTIVGINGELFLEDTPGEEINTRLKEDGIKAITLLDSHNKTFISFSFYSSELGEYLLNEN